MNVKAVLFVSICALLLASCDDGGSDKERKPIVLGDPTTIVNETDSQYLSDFVVDIESNPATETGTSSESESATEKAADASADRKPATEKPATPISRGAGLNIAFKEVAVFIPNIATRTYRTQNPQTANGVTYELTTGQLAGNKLQLSGSGIQRVSQRYITTVVASTDKETLELNSLGYTSDWKPIQASGTSYTVSGLEAGKLEVKTISPAQIRNAISRAARSKRLSRASIQGWEGAVRNVRSLKQSPFVSKLRSVMWKIDGKDPKGRAFSKQVRIDIPVK